MKGTIEYKPAVLAAPVAVEVGEERIELRAADGRVKKAVDVAAITSVRWHQSYAARIVTRRLDLVSERGTLTLQQTLPATAGASDPRLVAYVDAVRKALARITAARPDVEVELGGPAYLRWIGFVTPLAIALVTLLPLNVLLGRRDAGDFWWLGALLAAVALFALYRAWRARPWRTVERVSLRSLAGDLGAPDRHAA